jgi:hypothetical protein
VLDSVIHFGFTNIHRQIHSKLNLVQIAGHVLDVVFSIVFIQNYVSLMTIWQAINIHLYHHFFHLDIDKKLNSCSLVQGVEKYNI